ncbi:MAG: Trk family potassium uptake protein [Tyzzerella sp.]|nr:Trk family potassium uptake protein [Tyzzerella sp.]
MGEHIHRKKHLTSFQFIILGFTAVIFIGTFLLMLPIATKSGQVTPLNEAIFTSTSAVCVTGLVVQDTATYWSLFGQIIILLLIQIGGMGVITVAASFALLSGRKITLMQRSTMQEAIAAPKVGGIVRLTGFVIKITFIIEFLGGLIMLPVFVKEFGLRGIWMAIFHSISAFCNAGFDIMGTEQSPFVSLASYVANPVISITIVLLIIVGGMGFLTWDDMRTNKYHIKQYRMQSKVILLTTCILIVIPTIYLYFAEFQTLPKNQRLLASIFQAVTPRTAGFNTTDLTLLSGVGRMLLIILMLIGGSPGSTAGGMKTTTIAVLFANAISVFRRKEDAHFFGRRIEQNTVKDASTILMMYLTMFLAGAFIISIIEKLPIGTCLFETASAIGTVGLTLGITTQLGVVSQFVLIVLMFFGRVGGLTLIFAALSGSGRKLSKLPQEKITVG